MLCVHSGPVVFHHLIHLQTESFPDFLQMCTSLRFLTALDCDISASCSAAILLTNTNSHLFLCSFPFLSLFLFWHLLDAVKQTNLNTGAGTGLLLKCQPFNWNLQWSADALPFLQALFPPVSGTLTPRRWLDECSHVSWLCKGSINKCLGSCFFTLACTAERKKPKQHHSLAGI